MSISWKNTIQIDNFQVCKYDWSLSAVCLDMKCNFTTYDAKWNFGAKLL